MALTPRQMAVIKARARAKKATPAPEMQRPTALGGLGYQPEEEASRQAFRQGAANVAVPSAGPQQPKAPTRLSAAAGQFAQSATLGQAPNILAAPYALTGQFPEAKAFYQQRLMQGAEKFPVTTGAADIAGFLAPGGAVLKGVTTLARPVTRAVQTAPAIVRGGAKVVGGAGLGATEGALYGATVQAERQAMEQGQAAPTMQQRGEAAAMGAVVGGALPIVGKALAPVGTAIAGQAVKAFGPGATARQAERVAQKAVRADLQRAGINNLDDFLKAAEQYQGKPAMTGEIAQSTLNTLTALVRGKGTTGDKVQAILADRVAGFPARMMRDLEASTGLKADEILGDIDAMVKAGRETATPQYDIAKAAPFRVSEKLQNLIDRSPTVQQAVEAARGVIADKAAAAGKSVDEIPPLEFYDEVKQQIDRIEFSGRKMGDRETRQIDEVRRAFVQALDEIVPGAYAQARKAGGEAPKIREAVKLGQNSYTKPLEQVVSDIAGMGEPALKAYRGAFVTNLVNKIRMGQLKPAALRSPNLRDKMATLFGEDAADQLVTKFSQEFDLLKKGSRLDPNVGSVTSQALLGAPDQALDDLLNAGSAAVEFAQNLARGNLFGMGGQILNYFRRAGYTEAQLNAIGDLLASDPQRAARILFPNEMARLGATPGGAAATNVLANPTQPPSGGRNTLAMPPEVGGAFVGGALGATQGETPEQRARNALLGAAGGAVGGRMARGMTPDKTRMGSNLGNVPKPVQKAQAKGYEGQDIGEAKEWVAARSKGLDMSPEARAARAKEMGFLDTVWYHGTARLDRLLEKQGLDPKRATSGPMPYFTENPQIASKYAIGKADNSLPENQTYAQAFTVSPKDLGQAKTKTPYTVEQSWYFLSPEQKKTILDRAKRVGYENLNEGMGPLKLHPEGVDATLSSDQFDYIMKTSARGNPLAALRELWLDSGALFNEEQMLKDIYKLAGYPHRISDSTAPWYEAQGILNAKLRMLNPVVTDDAQTVDAIIKQLKQDFATDRTRTKRFGADDWDKNTRFTPKEWVAQLEKDMSEGTNSYVWTSIPDKITSRLKAMGFDGVIDTGGKGGGIGHRVAIPFEANQVRSVNAAFDPASKESANILAGVGAVGAGAAMTGAIRPPEQKKPPGQRPRG